MNCSEKCALALGIEAVVAIQIDFTEMKSWNTISLYTYGNSTIVQ